LKARVGAALKAGVRGEALFAVIMMAASSLGFIKAIGVAAVLPPAQFGLYISFLGIATLCSILCSLGRVEATIKLYPTFYARGQGAWIARHAFRLWGRLACVIAAGGVAIWAALALWHLGGFDAPAVAAPDLVLIALTAWLVTGLTLVASLVRAIPDTGLLQRFTVTRGGLVMCVALPAAYLSQSWRITLLAEAVAMVLILGVAVLWLKGPLRKGAQADAPAGDVQELAPETFKGGGALYLAGLVNATVPYGGRATVLFLSGAAVAGAFGLLTLLVQIGIMLASALSQRLGPRLIRDAANGRLDPSIMVGPLVMMALLSVVSTLLLLVSLLVPAGAAFWSTYGIGAGLLAIVGLHLVLPSYLFLKFLLIARNEETAILKVACITALCFYGGVGISGWLGFGLWGYVCAAAFADLVQLLVKSYFVFWKKGMRDAS